MSINNETGDAMKRHTNGMRWIVGLLGVILALCLVPVAANATGGTEGEPAAIETAFVNAAHCPGIEQHDFARESLYDVLGDEFGIHVEHGIEHITITKLNSDEAKVLQAEESSPAYFQESLEKDAEGGTVEYVKAVVLPNRYRFASNGEEPGVKTKVGATWLRS